MTASINECIYKIAMNTGMTIIYESIKRNCHKYTNDSDYPNNQAMSALMVKTDLSGGIKENCYILS